ncbi:hypothetical protein [Streptomyces viridochromogenes]|uniref:hypothetical protein n=1 Tax=Streptomyces viridochromogenes TaxID=1938 RepID=UPI00069F88F7|nr:hypothetical protein [Streptomyces viridochromogenes]
MAGGPAVAGIASADAGTEESETSATAATEAAASATVGVRVLNAEVTEGPYALEGALVREDIREDTEGFEVRYTFTVADTASDCAAAR